MTVVVVGDALLDVDWTGRVDRLTPDGPAPVLELEEERTRPGGAALAASYAAAAGADVVLAAPLGDGPEAARLSGLLERDGVRVVRLPGRGDVMVKRRLLVGTRTLGRVDSGGVSMGAGAYEVLRRLLARADAVLVSDYGRGVTAAAEVRAALDGGSAPLVWDPHPRGAAPSPGTTLATPNAAEARTWAERTHPQPESPARDALVQACADAVTLVRGWQAGAVAVTLGAHGVLLQTRVGPPEVLPVVPARGEVDACGAGDAFAAAATVTLAGGGEVRVAVRDGASAAAEFVAAGGAGTWQRPVPAAAHRPGDAEALVAAVRARGGRVVATGGCFDLLHAGHLETLRAARALGDVLVVLLNSDRSVRALGKPGPRPLQPEDDRRRLLEALEYVDAVTVFEETTPDAALRRLRPDVWVKGGDYAGRPLPEQQVLAEWGGRAVVLPYRDGRSTTALLERIRRRDHVLDLTDPVPAPEEEFTA